MAFLKPDGSSFTVFTEQLLGCGTTGIVLRHGSHALKIPKLRDTTMMSSEERELEELVNDANRSVLEREKSVYLRVGKHDGIADCVNVSEQGILLLYYRGGDLETYIEHRPEVDTSRKARWILAIIKTVLHFHNSNVLIDDIALRNILVADDFSLKLIDFGQCSLFPQDVDITTVSDNGMTAEIDIFHLGCAIYSIAAWTQYECNLFQCNFQRPPFRDLPVTDYLLCQKIIHKCWTGEYSTMKGVLREAQDSLSGLLL